MRLGGKLFWLCQLYTLFVMFFFGWDFLSHGSKPVGNNLVVVYFAFLAAYAGDKELRRWTVTSRDDAALQSRKGSLFVVIWALFYMAAYAAQAVNPGWKVPEGLGNVVVGVLGVFFGTSASKNLFGMLRPEGTSLATAVAEARRAYSPQAIPPSGQVFKLREAQADVLRALKGKGDWSSVSDVIRMTGLNRRTALRHLNTLVDNRQIRVEGEKRGTRYRMT